MISTGMLFLVHISYVLMNDTKPGEDPSYLTVLPLIIFGLGHAFFVTL